MPYEISFMPHQSPLTNVPAYPALLTLSAAPTCYQSNPPFFETSLSRFRVNNMMTIMFVISPSSPQLNGLIEALEMIPYQPNRINEPSLYECDYLWPENTISKQVKHWACPKLSKNESYTYFSS
ncbi:hypothetical protein BYT27DRAFT_6840734 [Phlegmacium glaucopus]|nr:hypothetical protein BYT27DRAFT_6840734 [Phlegmacium glaucopus]